MKTPWARDNRVLLGVGLSLGLALAGIYALVLRARALAPPAATNRVLLFVLFYIVVLLILALLFVIGRSAVRVVLESRRGVFGSRFRVRIVLTHVGLALLPIALLILPTTGLLQRSVEIWFQTPVTETVSAGREVVELVRQRAAERERRVASRLATSLAESKGEAALVALLASLREDSGLDYLELRPAEGTGLTGRLAVGSPRWPLRDVPEPSAEWISSARARGAVRRIDAIEEGGQVGRTIVVLPAGILILGTYDPPSEAGPLRMLSRATSAFAQLEAERTSLQAVQVLLFLLLALLVLLAAVWIGLVLARRVTGPIGALAASVRRVGAGDFDTQVEIEGEDEISTLGLAFNSMTDELRESRGRLIAANAELQSAYARLDEDRFRIRTILAHLDVGVLAFGPVAGPERGEASLEGLNDAALRMLRRAEASPGTAMGALLDEEWRAPLLDFLDRAFRGTGPREATLSIAAPGAREPLVVEAHVTSVPGDAGRRTAWVVTLEDTTALVRAERAAAWEEAARRMAHEIKNPLTPVRLAAERMRRKARSSTGCDPVLAKVVEEGADTIVQEVRTLAALVDAFHRFARLPETSFGDCDLGSVVGQVVKLYDGTKAGVRISADLPEGLAVVRGDAQQIKRAVVNLVDNAVSATPPGGEVRVRASVEKGVARVVVADDGPGIPAEERDLVFEPTFSTKAEGFGLGLSITSRIAAEHRGRVLLEENSPRGCRFVLEWPAA
ncbi:MAG: HAMP domain-containing protein [Holophagales bacterium]|nr:HAMP domain-containing protein [Holophagales bacterium]MBK9963603.1 HAMP domain-containing protein [Holophagales bacterium]